MTEQKPGTKRLILTVSLVTNQSVRHKHSADTTPQTVGKRRNATHQKYSSPQHLRSFPHGATKTTHTKHKTEISAQGGIDPTKKDIPEFVNQEYENRRKHRISIVENGHIPQQGHGNRVRPNIWVTLTGTHTTKGTPPQSDSQIIIGRRKRNVQPTDTTRHAPTCTFSYTKSSSCYRKMSTGKPESNISPSSKDQTPKRQKINSIHLTKEPTAIATPTEQAQITPQPVSIRHPTELLGDQPHRCPVYRKLQMPARSIPQRISRMEKIIAQDSKILQRPPFPDRDQQTTGISPPSKNKQH